MRRMSSVGACGSGSTAVGRSPTSSPTTGASPRSRRRPTIRLARSSGRSTRSTVAVASTCSRTGRRSRPTRCSNGAVRAVALVATARLRRRDRDRAPGPPVAVRPVRRPAARRSCRATLRFEVSGPARRARRRDRAVRRRAARRSPTRSTRSRCACCTPTSTRGTSARSPTRCGAARPELVVCSHEVSPEFREYERMVTTVVEAFLEPVCAPYLDAARGVRARGARDDVGGRARARRRRRAGAAASLLLSGPAGGVRAAAEIAAACGFADAVSFDMGGTSTDVCLVRGRRARAHAERVVAGLPDPAARARRAHDRRGRWFDRAARRGRRARRRPAQRGRGARARRATAAAATEPTVTDADLVLGRIPADCRLPRSRPARRRRGARARSSAPASTAEGVVRVVDAAMERAVRVVTVERGVDPRDLALVAFGGAGPLHACAIADALGMRAVIVPPRAGVCSAVGLAVRAEGARGRAQLHAADRSPTRSRRGRARSPRARRRRRASSRPRSTAATSARATSSPCATPDDFPAEHERRNGHARPGRADRGDRGAGARRRSRRRCASPICPTSTARAVVGPAVVAEPDCTVWVPDGLARRAARARRLGRGARRALTWIRRRCRSGSRGSRAWPTRWARCCGAPRTARTSRSAPTARARCSRPTARCSRRPSTSPCTSARCPRRCAPRSTRAATASRPGDQIVVNDPFAGGTHLNDITFVAPVFADDGDAARVGREPRAPRRCRRHGARLDAARRDRDLPGRPAHPAGALDAGGRGARRRRVADARRAARRPRRAASARTGSACARLRELAAGAATCSTRSSTTANAGCAPRSRRCPTATYRVRRRARLDRRSRAQPHAGAHRA